MIRNIKQIIKNVYFFVAHNIFFPELEHFHTFLLTLTGNVRY